MGNIAIDGRVWKSRSTQLACVGMTAVERGIRLRPVGMLREKVYGSKQEFYIYTASDKGLKLIQGTDGIWRFMPK